MVVFSFALSCLFLRFKKFWVCYISVVNYEVRSKLTHGNSNPTARALLLIIPKISPWDELTGLNALLMLWETVIPLSSGFFDQNAINHFTGWFRRACPGLGTYIGLISCELGRSMSWSNIGPHGHGFCTGSTGSGGQCFRSTSIVGSRRHFTRSGFSRTSPKVAWVFRSSTISLGILESVNTCVYWLRFIG